jgi:hypothetical protein
MEATMAPEGETFEQSDEALDEESRIESAFIEELEQDPSLDPALQIDHRELEEVDAELDDPEALVTLEGGIDDPDGSGGPTGSMQARLRDNEGWDLDAPLASSNENDLEDRT